MDGRTERMAMIKVFTTNKCAYCPSVKKYLDMKGAAYEVIDVTDEPKLIEEASHISNVYSVPQTLFPNGKVVVGPNMGQLAEQLKELNDE